MKKFICLILSAVFMLLCCGCNQANANNTSNTDKAFSQEVTIVKMPSPPKCKTSNSIAVVDEVIAVLGEIEKSSPIENINGGWSIMIKLKIDGQELVYTIGNIFTDADGKQYNITNYDIIEEKINEIYNKIDTPEVQYP